MPVRRAEHPDLVEIVALSAQVRGRLAAFDPHFWRPHADADATQEAWFGYLLEDAAHAVLVAEGDQGLEGFVIGRLVDAPPVYDPGGGACMVDDFAWRTSDAADPLLSAVRAWGAEHGAVTLVVVTAALDQDRRETLDRAGLHRTSEWWTSSIP